MNLGKVLKNGIFYENPTLVQVVGMCPVLAVSTSASNGIGMGISATAVLVASNMVISLLRKVIPDEVRIPCFVVVIASFVTIIEFLLKAYFPELDAALGIYIPLIVVNCIILARAEAFAFKNDVISSFVDGIGMGLGFTIALVVLGAVREIIGTGKVFGITVLPEMFPRTTMAILPPGAFIALALLMAGYNYLMRGKKA